MPTRFGTSACGRCAETHHRRDTTTSVATKPAPVSMIPPELPPLSPLDRRSFSHRPVGASCSAVVATWSTIVRVAPPLTFRPSDGAPRPDWRALTVPRARADIPLIGTGDRAGTSAAHRHPKGWYQAYRVKIRYSRTVSAADISNEARQPNRLEKKKNIWSVLRIPADHAFGV